MYSQFFVNVNSGFLEECDTCLQQVKDKYYRE